MSDLPGVEQLELLGALVEIVAVWYAISPLLLVQSLRSTGSTALSILRSVVIWIECAMVMRLGRGFVLSDGW